MPRTKSEIWDSFVVFKRNNKIYGKCKFCGKLYLSNATKMGYHLLKCGACPDERKVEIRNNRKTFQTFNLGKNGTADTSENANNNSYVATPSSVETKFQEEDNQINEALARALCNSSLPLSLLENKFFSNFIKTLQPMYNVPSKDKLASVLLTEEFRKVKYFVDMQFENATSLTLVTSGWNSRHIEIFFATPKLVFSKSISSDTDKHTPEYIFDNLRRHIDEVGSSRVSAVLTSYHESMALAVALVRRKYPQIVVYGCVIDGLNLFSKEIIKTTRMQTTISTAGDLVRYFSGMKLSKKNVFLELQNNEVGDAFLILETIIEKRFQFQKELTNLAPKVDACLKNFKNERFWNIANECLIILSAIADMITEIINKKPTLEFVYSYFESLKTKISLNEILKCLPKDIFPNWCYILAANFLNPKLHTSNMSEENVAAAMEFITDLGTQLGIDDVDLLAELAEYKVKDGDWHVSKSAWKVSGKINASTWWKCFFATKNITKVACRLLNMPSIANDVRSQRCGCHSLSPNESKYEFIRHNENLMSEEDFKTYVLMDNEDVDLILQAEQQEALSDSCGSNQVRDDKSLDELDGEEVQIKQEKAEHFTPVEEESSENEDNFFVINNL